MNPLPQVCGGVRNSVRLGKVTLGFCGNPGEEQNHLFREEVCKEQEGGLLVWGLGEAPRTTQ